MDRGGGACACAPRSAAELPDAADEYPSLGPDAARPIDPLASDAALGVRATQVLNGCQGGPESACHGSGAAGTHLLLGPGGDLVNVPSSERPSLMRVAPGDARSSYLYLKVLGDGGIDGGRMPAGGPFDPRLAPFIASWIAAGAPAAE
ncbi:MAG TPA: hypothetical protein VLT33_48265 [Labilithrix sp.]|nr:hypothetical protein [Labilithrix sp.]